MRLRTFGALAMMSEGDAAAGHRIQRRQLALLAVLAAAGATGATRDQLLALFWPDMDFPRARHALDQSLYTARRLAGTNAVVAGPTGLTLDADVLASDVGDFVRAIERHDLETAVAAYTGPFLDGVYLTGAPEFERWVERRRSYLASVFLQALMHLAAAASAKGDFAAAVVLLRRAVASDPLSGTVAHALMLALASAGQVNAALDAGRVHGIFVREQLDSEPDLAVRELMASLRAGSVSAPAVLGRPRDVPDAPATAELVARRRLPLLLGAAAAVLLLAGGAYAWHGRDHRPAGPTALAVLPFDSEADTANAYRTRGITDEIRAKLAQLPTLRLIASTSSNQYRHTQKPMEQIGRELGVRYLLIGRVQWEHGANGRQRVRVSPELIEVRDGAAPETKWQQSYDTTLADVFDVQAAVATRVAEELGVVLGPPAQTQLAARPTQNLSAYDAYLRSMALSGEDPQTLRRALALAEQAVVLDSTFAAAWSRVSELHAGIYVNSIPIRGDAEAAHRAAELAVALAPNASEGYIARGVYNYAVANDVAGARAAFETAVRLAPSSSDAIGGLAFAEAAVGQLAAALGHARQSAALDPRSKEAATRLSYMLLSLRRYPEARAEAERGLTANPADLALTEDRAMSQLGEGDLAGARAVLRDIPPTLDRAALAAYMTTYQDLYWVLDSADRALVLTLRPSGFDDDRGEWGLVHAELYWLAGDTARARGYADSARVAYDAQLRATPDAFYQHLFRGLTLAYLGQRAAAARDGERGLALAQARGQEYYPIPYARHVLARIYIAAGDHPHALDQLDALFATPYFISPAWLRIDPTWAPLRGEPRFERLVAQPTHS